MCHSGWEKSATGLRCLIRILQCNLHHYREVISNLSQTAVEGGLDVALIQEPWQYKGRVKGVQNVVGYCMTLPVKRSELAYLSLKKQH